MPTRSSWLTARVESSKAASSRPVLCLLGLRSSISNRRASWIRRERLKLEELPPALLVVGGGYIGLELGCVYAALGSKVTVVELTDGLLPGCDRDLVRPLQQRLEHQFHKIYLNTKVTKLTPTAKGVKATLEGNEIEDKEPEFGRVLVAVGRRPNSQGIGLDKAGVVD